MEQRTDEKYLTQRARGIHVSMLVVLTLFLAGTIPSAASLHWKDLWMVPFLIAGTLGAWVTHIRQLLSIRARSWFYAILLWFITLFAGAHPESLNGIAVMAILLLVVFAQTERRALLHITLFVYLFLLLFQIIEISAGRGVTAWNTLLISQLVLYTAIVLIIYVLLLATLRRREQDRALSETALRELDEAGRRTDNFMTNVSHELRTPVNVVIGLSSVMQTRCGNPADREDAAHIFDAGKHIFDRVDDILDYTEIGAGRFQATAEPYMITSVVNDAIAALNIANRTDVPDMILDMDATLPMVLKGDARRIRKVIVHLIDNAIKFTHKGGIYVNIHQIPQDYGINLCIEVRDTGAGMSKETLERVREGIYQEDAGRDREHGGFGMGLRIVHGIVHAMNGFVRITSEVGGGTNVHVTIPQEVTDARPCIGVKNAKLSKIAFYQMRNKFDPPVVSSYYMRMIGHVISSFSLTVQRVSALDDLKQMLRQDAFTHLFIADDEYIEDPAYFDGLCDKMHVVMVERGLRPVTPSPAITVLKKPFYILQLAEILNAEDGQRARDVLFRKPAQRFDHIDALVVDDEEMNLVVARGIFEDYGMHVDTASSGQEAIDMARRGNYHVIFMDHMMPGMDGVEAAHRIRDVLLSINKKTHIIALTANAVSGAREMFIREGFDGFVAKPIERQELTRVLTRVLSGDDLPV